MKPHILVKKSYDTAISCRSGAFFVQNAVFVFLSSQTWQMLIGYAFGCWLWHNAPQWRWLNFDQ
jgi:hypothetical protein